MTRRENNPSFRIAITDEEHRAFRILAIKANRSVSEMLGQHIRTMLAKAKGNYQAPEHKAG
jgi:hypothetical protein